MADRFYSVARGAQLPVEVTEGSVSSGLPIEVRVNDSVYAHPLDVIVGLRAIIQYLETRETNPIG